MSRKIWLIISISLILIGCIIFTGVMMVLNWDFTKLSTVIYETNEYAIAENYKNISIVTDTADIVFIPSENSKITCYEQKNAKHSVTVKEDTLSIQLIDTRKWYEHIGINFGSPKITIHIPQCEYGTLLIKSDTGDTEIPQNFKFESIDVSQSTGDVKTCASSKNVKIKTSTGNIDIKNATINSLNLFASTGNISLSDINCEEDIKIKVSTGKTNITNATCKNIVSSGSTGNLSLINVIAEENFNIERSTGDINFKECDANEIFVETDTGDVKGTLLSDKVFITSTDTGSINVPKSVVGGKCEISTDTGNITITVP